MSTATTIAKGSAWMMMATFIASFLGWIYYVLLARTVSQEEIGMFFLVLSVISMVEIFSNLGLGAGAIIRYIPFYAGKQKFNYVRNVLKISISAGTIFSIVCIILIILFTNYLSTFFHNPDLIPIFYTMAFYLLISNFYNISANFLQGRKLIKFVSYMRTIKGILNVVLTATFLVFMGFKAESIAFGYISAYALTAVIGWYWVSREYKILPKSYERCNHYLLLKEMVPFGLTWVLILSVWTINTYTDRIMLGYFLPAETASSMIGIYTVVIAFSTIITIFAGAVGSIFYPLITELWGKGNTTEMNKATITVVRWLSLTTMPLLLMMLAFPKQLLIIFYGEEYALGYIVLMLYASGLFIQLFSHPSSYILAAMKRLDVTTKIVFIGATINVILNFIFIPKYGINGAALASLISFTIMTIMLLMKNKITNVQIPKDIYKPVIAGFFTIILLFFLKPYINEILATLIPRLITPENIVSEITVKLLKLLVLGIFISSAFLSYLIFLVLLKAFHKDDVEILSGAMRMLKIPDKWTLIIEKILLRK